MAFNQVKTAQAASHILATCGNSHAMDVLKLMKLLYLSDRAFLTRYGTSISGDRMVSMPHGPVLSQTLDLMNGAGERIPDGWEARIADRAGHVVSLRNGSAFDRDSLDELSDMEIQVIDGVCHEFGHMSGPQLRNYTHAHCPEWEDPRGSSTSIRPQVLFAAVGATASQAREKSEQVCADERIDRVFANL